MNDSYEYNNNSYQYNNNSYEYNNNSYEVAYFIIKLDNSRTECLNLDVRNDQRLHSNSRVLLKSNGKVRKMQTFKNLRRPMHTKIDFFYHTFVHRPNEIIVNTSKSMLILTCCLSFFVPQLCNSFRTNSLFHQTQLLLFFISRILSLSYKNSCEICFLYHTSGVSFFYDLYYCRYFYFICSFRPIYIFVQLFHFICTLTRVPCFYQLIKQYY